MSEESRKIFLLDAFALIYRSYFAFAKNPRINSKGMNTSAMFGFTNTLLEILDKEKPSHIAVVFDPPGDTVRHEEFTEYKANRDEMPEDIRISIPWIKRIIEAFNIPVLMAAGYEADDVIGTLAQKAEKEGFITYMMTPDKDYGQLITENIFMYRPARGGGGPEIWGIPEVCEKFEIKEPLQVIDILALWGDAVDNIPGIPGVGEKTAKKLIGEYGSVEGLLENTDKLKGKLKERVEQNTEQALLSKRLATIITDAPVDFVEEDLRMSDPNENELRDIFKELEFRRMAERIFGPGGGLPAEAPSGSNQMDLFSSAPVQEEEPVSTLQTLETVQHDYHFVDTPEKRTELIKKLAVQPSFCFDTETTGLDALSAELVGIAFSWNKGEGYYVPVPADQDEAKKIALEFKAVLEDPNIEKIGQNIKYDLAILRRYDIDTAGKFFDTLLAHYLIEPDMQRRNMDILAETYLNYKPVSIETLIGKKGKNQKSMRDVEPEEVSAYACEDADITLQLKEIFAPKLIETGTQKLFEEVELPLIRVLADMEQEGIMLDTSSLKDLSERLAVDIVNVEKEIHDLAGAPFKISSPKQVGEILFDRLQVTDKPKKTKTGQYATSEDVLVKLKNEHPIVEKILTFRELNKLKNTYVDTLPGMVSEKDGKIHTSYRQAVAATGRLSSDHPNLQNIPIRTERGREIRKAFVPRGPEYTLLSADYSQIELRIIAELSQDPAMVEAFTKGEDIHAATAANVFGVPIEEVDREMRSKAKAVNFGIAYGQSAFGLSQNLNIPRREAKEIIDQYFEKYANIKAYMDKSIGFAKEHGYVETILGRRRYLRDINSANAVVRGQAERNAINAPIQGSAADMIKIAMINIHKVFQEKGFKSKMLLQVHDELIFDVHRDELDTIQPLVVEEMQNAMPLSVPLAVESDTGSNWLEAH